MAKKLLGSMTRDAPAPVHHEDQQRCWNAQYRAEYGSAELARCEVPHSDRRKPPGKEQRHVRDRKYELVAPSRCDEDVPNGQHHECRRKQSDPNHCAYGDLNAKQDERRGNRTGKRGKADDS